MEGNKLIASSSPHIRSEETTQKIMLDVLIALVPALIASIYFFGMHAFLLEIVSIITAIVSEYICQKVMKVPVTVNDLSAVVTGLLLAFNMPATAPLWLPIIGSAFAIIVAKQLFGGLGNNFINPALAGRAMMMASWPVLMMNFDLAPRGAVDAIVSATPMSILKGTAAGMTTADLPSLLDMFLGKIPGCMGETSAILLILGGVYLIYKKVISWRIPVTYIGTVAILALITEGSLNLMLYHLFGGGLMLGAFFMATDYASSPTSARAQFVYAAIAGCITIMIRQIGGYPEGVSYSILLVNILAPLLDKYMAPRVFGTGGAK